MSSAVRLEESLVETTGGRLRGALAAGVHAFKGIPYGATTAGERRFRPPAPAPAWSGTRDALANGRRCPQESGIVKPATAWNRDTGAMGEDCLALNVWTPGLGDGARRPVMVWLHGGGYSRGSGGAPGLDGTNLARAGDVVVVTLNHRLNAFGHTWLADVGERFADAGNAGVLDIVQALRWVRDNAPAFGGDAGNVTLFGQSGGGSKVAVMMTMPAAQGLFHKAIIQSSSSHLQLATPESAARSARQLRKALGLEDTGPDALQQLSADALLAAYVDAVRARGGNDSFRPVVDGRAIANHPFDLAAPDLAAGVPLMIGSCETERSFWDITADPGTLALTESALRAEVARFVGIDEAQAAALIEGYRETHPAMGARDLYNVITTDHMYRRNDVEAAERKVRQGGAPVWLYELTWKTPVLGGVLRSPHTLCIPFVFGNVAVARDFVGEGPRQDALMRRMMGAWIAFARTGDPNHPGLAPWPAFDLETRPTMTFDDDCRIENDPRAEDLARINACPRFVSDAQWPEPAAAAR